MLHRSIGVHGLQRLIMYGIITCTGCRRKRIIDLSTDVSTCPYCGKKAETKKAVIVYKDSDQSLVRAALDSMSGYVPEEKEKGEDKDPLSTLAYKVEHKSDMMSKMELICEGLTEIKGTFTVEDVEEIVPGKGEQFVKAMLSSCMIYEVGYGRYKV